MGPGVSGPKFDSPTGASGRFTVTFQDQGPSRELAGQLHPMLGSTIQMARGESPLHLRAWKWPGAITGAFDVGFTSGQTKRRQTEAEKRCTRTAVRAARFCLSGIPGVARSQSPTRERHKQ